MQNNQSKIIIGLLGAIVLLLATVLMIFVVKEDSGKKSVSPVAAETKKESPTEEVRTVGKEEPKTDSVRVTDPLKSAAIESFFQRYSSSNKEGLVEELTGLYTDPSFYVKRSYSRDQLRKIIADFFGRTRTIDHYFTNLVAYELQNGVISAYVSETQETYDYKYDKNSKAIVYKNFHLIPTNDGYKCAAQYQLATQ